MVLPSGCEPKMQAAALSETGNKRGGTGVHIPPETERRNQQGVWNIFRRNYYTIFLVKLPLAIKPKL